MSQTREELEAAYKKAVKALEGEKRAAMKKAKALKGKKGKEALAAVETEYSAKAESLQTTLEKDIAALSLNDDTTTTTSNNNNDPTNDEQTPSTVDDANRAVKDKEGVGTSGDNTNDDDAAARERKIAKARKKREKQREKELEKERQIELETANAGPSMRDVELDQLSAILTPLDLAISEVQADGHCLYRSVAAQLSILTSDNNMDYNKIRNLCADTIQANETEFAPFCEYDDNIKDFDQYVDKVRNSAEWGGHLELRALRLALDRPIFIYSVQNGKKPMSVHGDDDDDDEGNSGGTKNSGSNQKEPIRLSYHLHYYALGEHYNQVVRLQ